MSEARQTQLLEEIAFLGGAIVPNKFTVNKFGRNQDVDTATVPEDIWEVGGAYPFQSANQGIEVVVAAGDAGKTIRWQGMYKSGDDYLPFDLEFVAASGTTVLSQQALIVYRSEVVAGGTNTANIDFQISGGGSVLARISAGQGQTLMAIWAGVTVQDAYCVSGSASMTRSVTNGFAEMRLVKRLADGTEQTKLTFDISNTAGNAFEFKGEGVQIGAGEYVYLQATSVTANDTKISGNFDVRVEGPQS
jgi:hypothetical protein